MFLTNYQTGTMDAMMTSKGDVWVRLALDVHQDIPLTHMQDPPKQVIENCNQEVEEVLR